MSVWDAYPNLSDSDMRTLVAITAQILLESDHGRAEFRPDLLLQATATRARGIQKQLVSESPAISRQDVQRILEDDELAMRACRAVLDKVKAIPELAARIEQAYQAQKQKMTGIETALLAGALVVLATRIKHCVGVAREVLLTSNQPGTLSRPSLPAWLRR